MVSKETEHFGQLLKTVFNCDFMLFKFETPFGGLRPSDIKREGISVDFELTDLESLAMARETDLESRLKSEGTPMLTEQQVMLLKDDKADLEQQLKEMNEELKRVNSDLETANKSIWDKERQIKQDKRDITHHENLLRNNKTKLQDVFEQLNKKEIDLKNSEKEIDNLRADIKKNELRFEQQKQRTDNFQNKYNETLLKLTKAQEFLGSANKIVRHKQNLLHQGEARITELEKILNEHFAGTVQQNPN